MHIKKLATVLGLILFSTVYADSSANVASTTSIPFYVGPLDQKLMTAPAKTMSDSNKISLLPATPSTNTMGNI